MSLGIEKTTQSGIDYIDQLISYRKWTLGEDRTITWTITRDDALFSDEPYGIRGELPYFRAVSNPNDIANIHKAMDVFSSILDINLKYVDERVDGEATIRFNAYDDSSDRSLGGGWAYGPYARSYGGDVWASWHSSYGMAFTLHEVGHVLALDHPGHATGVGVPGFTTLETVMSYTGGKRVFQEDRDGNYLGRVETNSLGIYDIAALQYLYGANKTHNADDTVYRFDPKVGFYTTLWDGGGMDSIDLSNYMLGAHVDLREGQYSSITYETPSRGISAHTYTGENAIGIAYGTVIENAFGSQGDDVIQGNAADNILIGNGGNDRLYGGDGNDRLEGGSGHDVLDGGSGADVLIGGDGDDVYYVDNVADVVVEGVNGGTDTVYLSIDARGSKLYLNVETLIAREGATVRYVSGNALDNRVVGNSGDNVLLGCDGNDVLVGGKGNDVFDGGLGNDTFVFNRGDGNDTICRGFTTPDDIDTLAFGEGITLEQLSFRADARQRNLVISIAGSDDSVTVSDYITRRDGVLDRITLASGQVLDNSDIDRLIDAMAAFSSTGLGQMTLPYYAAQPLAPNLAAAQF